MNTTASAVEHRRSGPARHEESAMKERRNQFEFESMARQLERPLFEIVELYARLYADLKSHAHVTDYLPIFVARRICATLSNIEGRHRGWASVRYKRDRRQGQFPVLA